LPTSESRGLSCGIKLISTVLTTYKQKQSLATTTAAAAATVTDAIGNQMSSYDMDL